MKKYFVTTLGIVMTMFLLSACGSESKEVTATTEEIFIDIQNQVELPVTFENSADDIFSYYGIDTALLEEFTFVEAEDAIKVDTIVLMKVKEESNIETVKTSLASIIDQKKDTMNNYLPEQYDIACDAVIENTGNFVYMIISKDVSKVQGIIESYTK